MTDQIHVLFSEEGEACAIRKWSKEPFYDAQTYVQKALLDTLAARVIELEAENKRLREGLAQAIDALDGKIPDLHERMCCNGHECGCQGSTNLCLLIHDLRAALEKGPQTND